MPDATRGERRDGRAHGPRTVRRTGGSGTVRRTGTTPTVAVFGGGVAGLTAAHELAVRGFDVTVYEARERFGGKARSFPVDVAGGEASVPGEHGFRFFPGFYWHLVDTMARIPDGDGPVADNLVATEETLIASVHGPEAFESTRTPTSPSGWLKVFAPPRLTDVSRREALFFAERVLEFLTSCRARRENELEDVSWWDYIEADRMSDLYRTHVANATQSHVALRPRQASARTMCHVYVQLVRGHLDPRLDAERILNGPTSEAWLDPWVAFLEARGVDLRPGVAARSVHVDGDSVRAVTVARDGGRVVAHGLQPLDGDAEGLPRRVAIRPVHRHESAGRQPPAGPRATSASPTRRTGSV